MRPRLNILLHRSAARHLRRGACARRHRHVRRRGGGRVAQARSARGEVEARPCRSCRPRHDPHDVDLVAGRDGSARRRVDRVAERIDRGAVRRRAPDRLDLSARPAHDAAQRARPRRVRGIRSVGRTARTRRQGLHRRQRAEPEPVLDAAVRRRRPRPRRAGVRAAAREDLRRAQVGLARHQRDRRRTLPARPGQGERRAADALTDRVHHRPRPRVSQVRPHASDHGHVRAASVPDPVEAAPGLRAPEHDDDRARRLPEARRVADDRVRTHGAGRRDVADHLRRVRLPDARADAEALALHAPRHAGRAGCDHRAAPGALLPAGDRDRALPADGRRDADLPRHRRARRERVAVGRLLPGRHAEDEHGRAPLGRARGSGRNGRGVREAEDREQLRERRLPSAPGRAGAAADRPDVRVGVHLHARG